MQKILVISLITLFGLGLSFSPPAEATGAFPSVMILKGQLTINGSNVPAGTKVEAYSQNGNATNLLDSTTNTREGWYGGNNVDTKLTFPEFSGTLFFKVTTTEGQAITVKSSEITKDSSSPINCPTASNITFRKDIACQYNINIGATSTPPAKPTLKGYATSQNTITLNWTQSSDANWENYKIYQVTDSNNLSLLKTISNKTTTTHTHTNLSSDTTYYYKISTSNRFGSTTSDTIAVLTQGSSTNQDFTLPTTTSTIPLTLNRPLKLQNLTDARLPRPVELLDTSGKHTALIPRQTQITTANNSNFTGTLNPPQVITVSTSLKPSGLTVLKAIQVGLDDQKLNFSQAVELTIELPNTVSNPQNYKVYYYDTAARKYKLAGNGGQFSLDNKTIKVLVSHFTTFVVLEATAAEINLASSNNNNTSSGSGSGSSSSSGGGSGPGGSSSTNTTPYTIPTTPSTTILTLTRPIKLEQTQGKLPRPLKLADPNRKTSTVIPKDTQVTTKTGQKFTGQLNPPKIISSTIVAQPANRLPILTAIQVGLTTQTLNFSQPVELTIPLPGTKFDRTKVKVYYYDPATRKYKLAGNGGQVATDNKTIKVLVSHFTTFVALESTAAEIATSSPSTPTSTLPTPPSTPNLTDLKQGDWYYPFVQDLLTRKIVTGYSDGTYRPQNPINRAELTKMIALAFQLPLPDTVTADPFPDVPQTAWYAKYVQAAKTAGIISGYPNGTFQPGNSVNRAETFKVLVLAAQLQGEKAVSFPDLPESAWYAPYVRILAGLEIITGYQNGHIGGGDLVTRAQIAKMISKTLAQQ